MRSITLLIVLLFSINMYAQDLKTHQWEHRILIVKIPNGNSIKAQKQYKEIHKSLEGMIERKLVLYTIVNEDFFFVNYESCTLNNTGKISKKLKEILNQKEDFEILLIGLDGGIKLKQTNVLTQENLFNIVDAMPMRSNELRKNQTKN